MISLTNKWEEDIDSIWHITSNEGQNENIVNKEDITEYSLVGNRAQTIPFYSNEEMFEIIGYLALPGRINSLEAEVPRDGRDRLFENLFPGQVYQPIEMGSNLVVCLIN